VKKLALFWLDLFLSTVHLAFRSMDFLKNTAAISSLVAALGQNPGWVCLAMFVLVSPRLTEAVAKVIEAWKKK
jgi:hypothetical protein